MTNIAILPLFLLLAALITLLVYFRLYSRHINRKLREEESTAHISMASSDSVSRWVIVIAAAILLFSIHSKLSTVENELEMARNENRQAISALQGQISDLEYQLSQQDSLIADFRYETGSYDPETQTCEVTFFCILNTYTEDTGITLNFGEYEIPFEPASGEYHATAAINIFSTLPEYGTLIVGNGDLFQTEQIDTLPFPALCFEVLPSLDTCIYTAESEFTHEDGKYSYSCRIVNDNLGQFTDTKLIVKVNDEIVQESPLTKPEEALSLSIPAEGNDIVLLYAVGTNEYGLTHEIFLDGFGTDGWYAEVFTYNTIYDADGNLLFDE